MDKGTITRRALFSLEFSRKKKRNTPKHAEFSHADLTPVDPADVVSYMVPKTSDPPLDSKHHGAMKARVDETLCVAHNSGFCGNCHERCPEEGAISMKGGAPTINPEICTGCGTCAQVCPAPGKAIILDVT